jgi:fructan beta-fructosidase
MRTTPWIELCKGMLLVLTVSCGLTCCHTNGTLDTANADKFRPVYHHAPLYGWMNDVNGLSYKDGEYHIYFQYNLSDSKRENMYWGHSVSKDLMHWDYLVPTASCDTLEHIFSDDLEIFSTSKVFWYASENKWVMIVSAGKEISFYDSKDKKDWKYMSSFGERYGVQPCLFEYPYMVELPVDGDIGRKKWALIVNVNPGCYFGGSATQYFIGDFDGTNFICDNQPNVTKWLDWGKDHYVTACFSNTEERMIVVPWMNNRQYCHIVPTEQFRGANALPRELGLYTQDDDIYLSAAPIAEVKMLRKESKEIPAFTVTKDYHIDSLLTDNDGSYELVLDITTGKAEIMGFSLFNDKGEKVDVYFNLPEKKLVMDRTKSGIVDFGKNSVPHELEAHGRRKTISINYMDDFALATWAPIRKENKYTLDIFVDKCSVEVFLNGGKMAMTNLVFPTEPYNRMCFYSKGGAFNVDSLKVYRLGL